MYKIKLPNNDWVLCEDYNEELQTLFDKADIDEGRPVDVIYTMDSITGEQLEIFRTQL